MVVTAADRIGFAVIALAMGAMMLYAGGARGILEGRIRSALHGVVALFGCVFASVGLVLVSGVLGPMMSAVVVMVGVGIGGIVSFAALVLRGDGSERDGG